MKSSLTTFKSFEASTAGRMAFKLKIDDFPSEFNEIFKLGAPLESLMDSRLVFNFVDGDLIRKTFPKRTLAANPLRISTHNCSYRFLSSNPIQQRNKRQNTKTFRFIARASTSRAEKSFGGRSEMEIYELRKRLRNGNKSKLGAQVSIKVHKFMSAAAAAVGEPESSERKLLINSWELLSIYRKPVGASADIEHICHNLAAKSFRKFE
jgi:hypothetical protein